MIRILYNAIMHNLEFGQAYCTRVDYKEIYFVFLQVLFYFL
jgi:hypothetical protein